MMSTKTYLEMIELPDFDSRLEYLMLSGSVGESTFGSKRYLNQEFYHSDVWKQARRRAILRDNGCDLAIDGMVIKRYLQVHHIVPITEEDIFYDRPILYDLNNLICVSPPVHKAIHYSDKSFLVPSFVERKPNDTCLWK